MTLGHTGSAIKGMDPASGGGKGATLAIRIEHTKASTLTGTATSHPGSRLVIGRRPDCDVAFDPEEDRLVSGHHAEITVEGDRVRVRDLDSSNGTFVNGRRIDKETALSPDDRVTLGPKGPEFRVRLAPSETLKKGVGEETLLRVVRGHVGRERRRALVIGSVVFAVLVVAILVVVLRLRRVEEEAPRSEDLLAETRSVVEEMQSASSEEARRELERKLEELRDSVRGEFDQVARKAAEATTAEERTRLEKRLDELRESVRGEFRDVARRMQEAESEEERKRLEKRLQEIQDTVLRRSRKDWTRHVERYQRSVFLCLAVAETVVPGSEPRSSSGRTGSSRRTPTSPRCSRPARAGG
jgi:pSer/pThr/pTyr-binding forkhead associated (FHA) protein